MSNVVGHMKMVNRIIKVTKEIAAKQGWEKADQRLQRHLKTSPLWLSLVTKTMQGNGNAPRSA